MSRIVELAQALADRVNLEIFPDIDPVAEVVFDFDFELHHLGELPRVQILPLGKLESVADSRGKNREELEMVVMFQKKCDPQNIPEMTGLMTLAERIRQAMSRIGFKIDDGKRHAVWKGAEVDPLYDFGMLRTLRVFSTAISIRYLIGEV